MKLQDAIDRSSVATATRPVGEHDDRRPRVARVIARLVSGKYGFRIVARDTSERVTPTGWEEEFEDWSPYLPYSPVEQLAALAMEEKDRMQVAIDRRRTPWSMSVDIPKRQTPTP